ncbi:hypothetical protein N7499_011609 [Penicillium canescens]|uniref:Uncharacterized protein n=1 Tax=Penicillium canescens TaxID=5083 RepID=A0AAD6ND23_PENCN|nr:uncharacterized protein N7446_006868 [Penicillium canescens]KAJ5991064.1 hypothetical protein N7522_011271 [Penicillium canescens]KAJ6049804.1 hypothetical protein N7444_006520 [Penicillium canescens]KAJ6052226.1 hypothetical protein N7460_002760 [Penicillium canescens]KAJ6062748.1 hypothetical protein N7446_006868 [Penicillium canescens]KAJ6069722.1 hypothetical protein N7499_011609 [Penicillium canescens]
MSKALDDKVVVLIGFDSCSIQGNPLPGKQGQMPDAVCAAEFENYGSWFEDAARKPGPRMKDGGL